MGYRGEILILREDINGMPARMKVKFFMGRSLIDGLAQEPGGSASSGCRTLGTAC